MNEAKDFQDQNNNLNFDNIIYYNKCNIILKNMN